MTSFSKALIIGSSGGIGAALMAAMPNIAHGVSRTVDGLDVTDEASVAQAAINLGDGWDLIINATGALELNGNGPEKSFAGINPDVMLEQFRMNSMGGALVLKHFMRRLDPVGPSVFATLSARVGSISDNRLGGWVSYRAAKAALNQIVHTASIELARSHKNVACVAIHPGTVTTPLTKKYVGNHPAVTPEEAARNILSVLQKLEAANNGQFFDWKGDIITW